MRLLLVDGHYFLYRSFFAIRGLKASDGRPTNAIYGFAKALRRMVSDVQPTHGAVAWDRGLPARRTELQPAYKQQRPEMPEDLRAQEEPIQAMCPLIGLKNVSLPDTEADDLIATYALAALKEGMEVIVATADKDILQLAGEGVRIYTTAKADVAGEDAGFALLGEGEVEAKWGVPPAAIKDVLSLTGDSADNIPGVPGVGGKTAASLLRQFGSIDALLSRLDEVENSKTREKLRAAEPLIRQNLSMVALDTDLPMPEALGDLPLCPDPKRLADFLRACEFKSLLREVEAEAGPALPVRPSQQELF